MKRTLEKAIVQWYKSENKMRIHLVLIALKVFLCWFIFMCIQWITMHSKLKKSSFKKCRQLQRRRKRPMEKESYKIWRKSDKIKYWLESIFRDNYALILILVPILICYSCVCVRVLHFRCTMTTTASNIVWNGEKCDEMYTKTYSIRTEEGT